MPVELPRASATSRSTISPIRMLMEGPWIAASGVVGWFTWAYIRLRPDATVTSSAHSWSLYGPWAWGRLAYSDVISLYYTFHLANHALPYVHTRIEYPVLTGIFMWLAAWAPGVQGYFLVSTLGLLACALGTLCLLNGIDERMGWAFALCPLLLVYGLLNWDLLAIFLMVAGWAQFRAHRHASAGVLLSLAVWAKFFPIILLFYCVVSLLRDPRDRVHALKMTLWAGGATLLINVPFAVFNFSNLAHFFVFNARRGGHSGILYELRLVSALSIPAVDLLSGALVALVVVLLVPRVLRGGSPVVAAAVAFTFLMLVNKVYSPQYMLWLFVFGVMAEWPVWSLVLMSVAGIVDYADAMMVLHLSHANSPTFSWFFRTVNPWNITLRYGSLALGLFGALTARNRRMTQVAVDPRPRQRRLPDDVVRAVQ